MSLPATYKPRSTPLHPKDKGCCQWLGTTKLNLNTHEVYECGKGLFYTAHYSPRKGKTQHSGVFSEKDLLTQISSSKDPEYTTWLKDIHSIVGKTKTIGSGSTIREDPTKCTCGSKAIGMVSSRLGHSTWCSYMKPIKKD